MIASIDIGTSYSSICMLGPDGKAHPVDISTGASMFGSKYSLPSAVFVEDSGNVLVGQAAMNSRKHKPQNFRMQFKRNLGEDIPILLGERSFKPEELYTELFRHMKTRAEKVSNDPIEKVYLTYPASYGEKRREKLCAAAKAAGLFNLELVDEPTAAAMCYCAEGSIENGQTLLVYDFGGGTFDVSLIRYQDGTFQLLSEPVGLERCGGMDIDYLIAQDMRTAIDKEVPGAWEELQKNQNRFMRFTSQINELAVKAKHHLSDANCFEEYIEIGMDDVSYRLTVERFDEMIAPLVGQTLQTCRRALDEAGVSASELSAVLMVGGTSRIPLVQEMARKITGKPALCAADLELIVAQGALRYNEYRKQEQVHGSVKIQEDVAARETEFVLRTPDSPPIRPGKPEMIEFPDPKDKAAVQEFYWKNADALITGEGAVRVDHRAVFIRGDSWRDIVSIGRSPFHKVRLCANGTVVAVGKNDLGQCNVQGWRDIVSIACGFQSTVGLHADGTVVAVGENDLGQCNVQGWRDIVSIACGLKHTVGLHADGTVVAVGEPYFSQCEVRSWYDIVSIACGGRHTAGLRADGTVAAVGLNVASECNVQSWHNIVSIACGPGYTVGLRADGTVVATGENDKGQCNVQDWRNIVSIACGGNHTVGLRADGTIVATGDNKCGQCNVQSFRDVIAVRADGALTIVLFKDGSIKYNDYTFTWDSQKDDVTFEFRSTKSTPYRLF